MYVKLDGKVVDEYYMSSMGYKNYYTDLKPAPGTHVLGLEYANDLRVGDKPSQDRDISVIRVSVIEV